MWFLLLFTSKSQYKYSNDDFDESSKTGKMGLTSAHGKVIASLHNAIPTIFGSKDSDAFHPFPNLKTHDKWLSCVGTARVNNILRDNLKKSKKSIYSGITSFIRDPVARVLATGYLDLIF